jgi:hypothetical protein
MRRRNVLVAAGASMAALSGCLGGDTEYKISEASIDSGDPAVSLSVEVIDPEIRIGDPGALEITLGAGETSVQIRARGVLPFGLTALRLDAESNGLLKVLLHSPAYDKSSLVEVSGGSISVDSSRLTDELGPGESVTERYTVRVDDVSTGGSYSVGGYFFDHDYLVSYRSSDEPWTQLTPGGGVSIEALSGLL